ncbi:MAG TPA: metallophosphoesterase family protein [Acidimicrobiales bacterium]|nr:metallophosphoesterase family protein [Acidimicrobiales bacterium]
MTRAVVLADTHIRPGRSRRLPDEVYTALGDTDVILHAGDVVTADLLDELSGFAPVHAVLGNNDFALAGALPETLEIELDGVRVAMIHDSGPAAGREGRMARRFPSAAIVVFGHSHAPLDAAGINGQRLFNPGSPTERRAQPFHTYGALDLRDGRIASHRIIPV